MARGEQRSNREKKKPKKEKIKTIAAAPSQKGSRNLTTPNVDIITITSSRPDLQHRIIRCR